MISRSVAQIATPSIRTSTSAFFGTGTCFSIMLSWPGSPSTQARCFSGTGTSLWLVFTPGGAYIKASKYEFARFLNSARCSGLRVGFAELGRQRARGCGDLVTHQRDVLFARPHGRRRGADGADHRAGLVADGRADANDAGQEFLAVDGVTVAAHDAQRFDQGRKLGDGLVGEAFHAV